MMSQDKLIQPKPSPSLETTRINEGTVSVASNGKKDLQPITRAATELIQKPK